MKNIKSSPILLLFATILLTLFIHACKKSSNSTPGPQNSFTLSYNGNTYKAVVDSAVTTSMGPSFYIIANFSSGNLWNVSIDLTSFDVNTYNFGSNNNLGCVDNLGNPTQDATTGSLNITSNADNRMSGNFTATVVDFFGTTYMITGNFTDMPISF